MSDLRFVDGEDDGVQAGDDTVPEHLPEWACAYCGICTPASVVRCLSSGKWFCNGRSVGSSASCILTHLVKSKSREVALHKLSPLGETVLECYATGSRNVFSLGYVPLKDENTGEDATLLLPPSCLYASSSLPRNHAMQWFSFLVTPSPATLPSSPWTST